MRVRQVAECRGHSGPVEFLDWSTDGRHLRSNAPAELELRHWDSVLKLIMRCEKLFIVVVFKILFKETNPQNTEYRFNQHSILPMPIWEREIRCILTISTSPFDTHKCGRIIFTKFTNNHVAHYST